VAQEKTKAFNGRKMNGRFQFDRDRTVYVNHSYFYIDDEDLGPFFIKVGSYAPWGIKFCLNGHEWAKRSWSRGRFPTKPRITDLCRVRIPGNYKRFVTPWDGWGGPHYRYGVRTGRTVTTGICRCGRWK